MSGSISKKIYYQVLGVFQIVVFFSGFSSSLAQNNNVWQIHSPVFEKGPKGTFDEISVKDPSIVFYENAWHLFYTARGNNEYTTGYVSAKDLKSLNTAPRFELKQIRGIVRYGCAPQVFYFSPQKKWYLIYQNRDANYQPVFSTNTEITKPELWTSYQNLIEKDSDKKWIDFWVIADDEKVYLFYTEAHGGVIVRSTSVKDFPSGWGESKKIFDNVHEAVHIYKMKDKKEFHMIYELNKNGVRSFGLARSCKLNGRWEKVTDHYANGNQLQYSGDTKPWTEMVSHGEVIRSGFDEKMAYDPQNCRWLIQGIMKSELTDDYPSLPWKLGIIEHVDSK
ncbi:MAG: hypothetical protein ACI9GZ_002002 [Bacteroidia bacterium]